MSAPADHLAPPPVPEGTTPSWARARDVVDVMPTPRWVRVVTVGSVSVVAAVAAVVSYVHMRELGIRAGEAWRADIIPLSADGLLVAASMVMLVRRRSGQSAGWLAWVGLVLGLLASLGANLAVADWNDPVSIAVSGWPPLALAVAFELLITVTRTGPATAADRTGTQTEADRIADELGIEVVTADPFDPAQSVQERTPTGPAPDLRQSGRTGADRTDDQLLAEVRGLADRTGKRPSRNAVVRELGVGADRAARLLEEFDRTGPRRTA